MFSHHGVRQHHPLRIPVLLILFFAIGIVGVVFYIPVVFHLHFRYRQCSMAQCYPVSCMDQVWYSKSFLPTDLEYSIQCKFLYFICHLGDAFVVLKVIQNKVWKLFTPIWTRMIWYILYPEMYIYIFWIWKWKFIHMNWIQHSW